MEQCTNHILTQKIIHDTFVDNNSGRKQERILFFCLSAFIVFFCVFLDALDHDTSQIMTPILLLLIPILFLVDRRLHTIARTVANKDYYIFEKTCTEKASESVDDFSDVHYLILTPYCKVSPSVLNMSTRLPVNKLPDLYETTEIGDRFYVVCSTKGQVLYIYNQKYWILNTAEFTRMDEGQYVPNKHVKF